MMIYSEMKDNMNDFLKNYAFWIALGIVIIIVITSVIIFVIKGHKKKESPIDNTSGNDWISALGGKENILEVNATGSRLTIKLQDINNCDKDKLKALGVSNIVTMSDKLVLVVEDKAELIKEKLN